MTTLLAFNPRSRKGDEVLEPAVRRLSSLGAVEQVELTDPDTLPRAIDALGGALERIVLAGGDGTLHHALDPLLDAGVPLGVLPLGTANDFARSLGLPNDIDSAAATVCTGRTVRVDLGRAGGRHFLNALGLGLGAELNDALDEESKARFGVISYVKTFLEVYRESAGTRVRLRSEGSDRTLRCLQLTVGNGPHYGGGMTVAQETRLDDGRLTVLAIRPEGTFTLMRQALLLRRGPDPGEAQPDSIEVFRCRRIGLDTRRPTVLTADGEQLGETPVHCEVLPEALEVYR